MRQRLLWLGFSGILITASAVAQEPSDSVKWVGANKIEVKSTVVASNGCYSAGTATTGHPDGATFIENAVVLTFPLEHSGGQGCTMALKPVAFSITTDVPASAQAVVIYITEKHTKSVSARAIALPARRGGKASHKLPHGTSPGANAAQK